MKTIAMLLSNPFRPDARVLKEAIGLSENGFKVTILAWDREAQYPAREILPTGVEVVRVQHVTSHYGIGLAQLTKLPRFWSACWTHLKHLKPDYVHCHDFDTLPLGLAWGRISHCPVVYDAHEYYADLVLPRLKGLVGRAVYHAIRLGERWGASQAQAVVTVDETLGRYFRAFNSKVLVIGHYPPIEFTQNRNEPFGGSELRLIYVGRLSRDRGLFLMSDILRELLNLGVPARLILAGTFTPAREEMEFFQYAGPVMSSVTMLGWVNFNQIAETIAQGDIGMSVLMPEPRYVAALPVKLFEYMASGLPVVASDFPAVRSVVESCQCGLLVDPKSSPRDIAKQIAVWWNDPAAARLAGEHGRQAVISKFNFETLVKKLAALYQDLEA